MKPILQIFLGVFLLFFVSLFFLQFSLAKESISELSIVVLANCRFVFFRWAPISHLRELFKVAELKTNSPFV
jgi:hypothetical protein